MLFILMDLINNLHVADAQRGRTTVPLKRKYNMAGPPQM